MQLKRYLLSKVLFLIIFNFSTFYAKDYIEYPQIKIIEIMYYNPKNMNEAWLLRYLCYDGKIFSGAFFDDYGSKYDFYYDKKYEKYIVNNLKNDWSNFSLKESKEDFIRIDTGNDKVDNFFYWRCYEICGRFKKIQVKMNKKDFFPFVFEKNKILIGFKNINFKKVKPVKELPNEFILILSEHLSCIEKLNDIKLFEQYIRCFQ